MEGVIRAASAFSILCTCCRNCSFLVLRGLGQYEGRRTQNQHAKSLGAEGVDEVPVEAVEYVEGVGESVVGC
jgi:hypothetical protein